MPAQPNLLSLATAVPSFALDQHDVMARARRLFAKAGGDIERLLPVFANAGIERRYSCVPMDWYGQEIGWRQRNALYLEHALDLIEQAAVKCLEQAGLSARDVDQIVVVSTSGIATPSLDARLMTRLPFRGDVQRLPIFGLGCAGGTLGLARAAALARADPEATVLFLVVELCALNFRAGDHSKSNIVATALFGDGAAAALISARPSSNAPGLVAWGEHTWPDTLDIMGWNIEDDGMAVLFSRDIPAMVRQRYRAVTDDFLARAGTTRADLAGYICHPGGAKVISALETAMELPNGAMTEARETLRDYGNMSAATVLFVLRRTLADCQPGRYLMSALGPGFTVGFLLLDVPSP